jgi:hypothetical protein
MEAKLETKSHRRQSRRARNMETEARLRDEMVEEEEWREAIEEAVAAEFGESESESDVERERE